MKSAATKPKKARAVIPDLEEEEYKTKCRVLKRRVAELEEANEVAAFALARAQTAVGRLEVEYTVLAEKLGQLAGPSAFVLYCDAHRDEDPARVREKWAALSEDERRVYEQLELEERERWAVGLGTSALGEYEGVRPADEPEEAEAQ